MQSRNPGGPAPWSTYYEHHKERPASSLLQAAMALASLSTGSARAIDLGCGAGNETRALMAAGWDVLAIDQELGAIERARAIGAGFPCRECVAVVQRFEDLVALPAASLIHAGMSMPFCHPQSFEKFWATVRAALLPGGIFVGQFFGDRDGWAGDPSRTFHSEPEVRALFLDFDLIHVQVHEYDGPSLRGTKHWHRIDVIAQHPL
ncbi:MULTISPECIES: class I SAM-dependent methyltransferase [Pseudomonas]|uniref:Class I SAM-dependent methyltransferase n=1 Tax=Pseudomonas sessilinigenes TaxID=658629 RepID=A0ABX8MKA1_9PSED|nr:MULTISPECIES: class I SAM-dependent methyltransferase [Pseudomonas]QXH39143.1 class I SAM-dependent methyltransferase [Pseudomonas sessilinigenes]UMZ09310.1 class I SAM-dependent methyltransferase [Pseudomonas sp. MPFS]